MPRKSYPQGDLDTIVHVALRREPERRYPGRVDLAVYDLRGRRVAELWRGQLSPGRTDMIWQGLDDTGQPAPSGVYYVHARGELFARTLKLTLVR